MTRPLTHHLSREFLNPLTDEYEEHEFTLTFTIQPAEPAVGIMDSFIDDWSIDAKASPDWVQLRIAAMQARHNIPSYNRPSRDPVAYKPFKEADSWIEDCLEEAYIHANP